MSLLGLIAPDVSITLDERLERCVRSWPNLAHIVLVPSTNMRRHRATPTPPLPLTCEAVLKRALDLRTLTLKGPVIGAHANWPTCTHLEELSLVDPPRAILDILPEWLAALSPGLQSLHANVRLQARIAAVDSS
jgi:hypothetical protein